MIRLGLRAPCGRVAALLALLSAPAHSATPSAPAAAVHPGQRAVVRTVFAGASVDSFEAEIVGTLSNGRTQGETILARATSDRVVHTGIAQGMSGSPVYVDGRLVGALSSGWAFSREPLFGITPIGEMLEILKQPVRDSSALESSGPSGADDVGLAASPRFRELRWAGDEDDAPRSPSPAPASRLPSTGLARLPLPLACAGLDPRALEIARPWLEPMGLTAVPGGRTTSPGRGAETLEPGAAVAVEVMRGDLQLAAIGTLTWRDGDRVLLFGHPFFQSGDVRMPLATADIVTVVANNQMSFKLGQRDREVGAVLEDRRPGVAGRLGAVAHMLPVGVEVRGAAPTPQRFHFETIEDRGLAPTLVAVAALNSMLESGGAGGSQSVRWSLRLHRSGMSPLELADVVVSDSPPGDLGTALAAPLRFLFGNPYAPLGLDSIDVHLDLEPGRESWTLRSARLVEPSVRAGGTVHVSCELERWRGAVETKALALTVPEEVPDGRYTLWVGGGSELAHYEAGRLPGRYRVVSLDDAWRRLAQTRPSNSLYAAIYARAPEVDLDGREYPELPASALPLFGSEQGAVDRSRRSDVARLDEQRSPVSGLLRGELLLNVVVDSRGPLAQP